MNNPKTSSQAGPIRTAFERSFSSEPLLQQAIAGLLTRMPDVSGVQRLHGAQELGKDLIFYIRGGFEETVLCACVVKNTKISGDAAKPSGARTILFQAEQAFDSNHHDGSGKAVPVERVYVVTPYDLPPPTIASIKGRLQQRAGQVVFMGGSQLFDLFKKYWPDYFADEAGALEQHIEETENLIDIASPLEELATQYNLGSVRQYDKRVYVQQGLYRQLNSYTLGKLVSDTLPTAREVNEQISSKEIGVIDDRLKLLRRFITALNDWMFCTNADREQFISLSDSFVSTLGNILEETKKEKKRLADRVTRVKKPNEVNKPEIEKVDYVTPARHQLATLIKTRDGLVAGMEIELTKLKHTLETNSFHGVSALSDISYLSASIVDEFAHSAPEGFFVAQEGIQVDFPKEILSKWNSHLMIVGAPGYGKTSFCRWHALHDAEAFRAGGANVIPVYVPLSRFSTKAVGTFEDSFLRSLGKSALVGGIPDTENANVRIYLDGLDEVALPERRKQIVELARNGVEGKDRYQIILTSRDYIFARWLDWLPRVALGGLEKGDINELIDKWLGSGSESNERFRHELRNIPMLEHLMRTPLLATLVIMVFRQTGKLPESKTRLYEIFTNLLSGGWDLAKGVLRQSRFGERVKIMVLSNLAGTLHERRRSQFSGENVKDAARAVLSGPIVEEWEALQQEFIIDGLVTKSGDVMHFSHLSFQEFLAARDFMGMPQPGRINRALESYLWGDGWWKELIKFYIGLSSNPAEIRKWVIYRLKQFHLGNASEVSVSQVQDLMAAISEAFPGYPKVSQREAEQILHMSKS